MSKQRVDPAVAFRFHVELEGIIVGSFTECTGLTLEREVETYVEGGVNDFVHILPGRSQGPKGRVTLKRGITASQALWRWYQEGLRSNELAPVNMSILLTDGEGAVVRRWDLPQALPLKWVGPDFNTAGDQIALETLEVGFGGAGTSTAGTVQRALDGESEDAPEASAEPATEPEIDVEVLAQKIYALLRRDLEIKRERLGFRY